MSFKTAMAALLQKEGGYTNNPHDPGGETKYGITKRDARENGYTGEMKDLPIVLAYEIYKKRYWDVLSLDLIEHEKLQSYLFDMAVNIGTDKASRIFQRALNVLRVKGDRVLYPVLSVDGNVGPLTLASFQVYSEERKLSVLLKAINGMRVSYYISISENNHELLVFTYGWLKERTL